MQNAIISDTSCLILLSKINELNILHKLYGKVIITSEIQKEFNVSLPDWIEVKNPDDERHQKALEATLDKGEASAIALAIELGNCLLILDDKKARNIAMELKLDFTGTYGIILNAKKMGYITSVKDIIDKIRKTDFRFSMGVENMIIKLSEE